MNSHHLVLESFPEPAHRLRCPNSYGHQATRPEVRSHRQRLKLADRPARRNRTTGMISLDVQTDRKGEFFEIVRQPGVRRRDRRP